MNTYEAGFFIFALCLLGGYLYWQFRTLRQMGLLLLFSSLPLYLSVERVTRFLTTDAAIVITETYLIATDPVLKFWFNGQLRTSDMVFGLLAMIRQKWLYNILTAEQTMMLIKGGHWLLSVIVLLLIYDVLSRHFVEDQARPYLFGLYIYSILLLPVSSLAIKTYTYDSLSLAFGILSLVLMAASIKTGKYRLALLAIIAATLAAQEKPTASPLLIASIATYAFLGLRTADSRSRYARPLIFIGAGIMLALAISFIGLLFVGRYREWDMFNQMLSGVPLPLTAWIWPFLVFVPDTSIFVLREALTLTNYALLFTLVIIAIYVLALIANILQSWLTEDRARQWTTGLWQANNLLTLIFLIVGLVGAVTLQAYLSPLVHIESGYYQPGVSFNGWVTHFGAQTRLDHMLASTAFQFAVIFTDIPTIVWLLAAGVVVLQIRREPTLIRLRPDSPPSVPFTDWWIELLLAACLMLPLLFGLAQLPIPVPVSSRYLNIPIVIAIILLCLKAARALSDLAPRFRSIIVVLVASLLVLELLPFAPLYGSFRPIWLNYRDQRLTETTPGVVDPVWTGWGEETMFVGEQLQEWCQDGTISTSCKAIRIYPGFQSIWLSSSSRIQMMGVLRMPDDEKFYTSDDYYIVSRIALLLGYYQQPDIEPVLTFDYRGYPFAWVYRGDDLEQAGFEW